MVEEEKQCTRAQRDRDFFFRTVRKKVWEMLFMLCVVVCVYVVYVLYVVYVVYMYVCCVDGTTTYMYVSIFHILYM